MQASDFRREVWTLFTYIYYFALCGKGNLKLNIKNDLYHSQAEEVI